LERIIAREKAALLMAKDGKVWYRCATEQRGLPCPGETEWVNIIENINCHGEVKVVDAHTSQRSTCFVTETGKILASCTRLHDIVGANTDAGKLFHIPIPDGHKALRVWTAAPSGSEEVVVIAEMEHTESNKKVLMSTG
jgi:hypothetical protein